MSKEQMPLFFEDIVPGEGLVSPSHKINRDEMVAFARTWDPLPFHVDDVAGRDAFGSITAPGLYVLAIKLRLIHQSAPVAVLASVGYDEIRFHEPVRPDDVLVLKQDWLDCRRSRTKSDRGIVKVRYTLDNQAGRTVMSHLDTLLVRRRLSVD